VGLRGSGKKRGSGQANSVCHKKDPGDRGIPESVGTFLVDLEKSKR